MSEPVTFRPIGPDDMELLLRVYASTREEELAPVPWTPEQKEAFLRMQFDAQHVQYQANYPGADFLVILHGGVPAGRLYVHRREKEIRLVDIALLPEHRRLGIGTALLRDLLAEGEATGKTVTIHVEINNPAQSLYERLGFRCLDERGYYRFMEWRPPGMAPRQESSPAP